MRVLIAVGRLARWSAYLSTADETECVSRAPLRVRAWLLQRPQPRVTGGLLATSSADAATTHGGPVVQLPGVHAVGHLSLRLVSHTLGLLANSGPTAINTRIHRLLTTF